MVNMCADCMERGCDCEECRSFRYASMCPRCGCILEMQCCLGY